MEKISATEVRDGVLIELNGRLWRVVRARHVHVGGRGGAYMQVEAKDVESGSKNNIRLRTDEKVNRPYVEQRKMRFLYSDPDGYVFMDEENYEQITLTAALFEERAKYILPDMQINVSLYDGRVIAVELPPSVVLTIKHTEPQVKSSTATSSYKPAMVDNDISVPVPSFVQTGEKIRVNVETGEYMERVSD